MSMLPHTVPTCGTDWRSGGCPSGHVFVGNSTECDVDMGCTQAMCCETGESVIDAALFVLRRQVMNDFASC